MRFLLLVSFIVNLKFVHSLPQPDDIFSSGLSEPVSDLDLFSSEELNSLDPNFNDLSGNPDEPIFSPSDVATILDPLPVSADVYTPSDNLVVADGSVDTNQLQSFCGTKGSVSKDALKARDDSSCSPIEGKEKTRVPDLFQDPESWWRKFPLQQNPPSEKQGATPLDSFFKFFQGLGGGAQCPPDYPIRCCTDLISNYNDFYNPRTLYYIKPLDCIPSMFPFPPFSGETPNMPESGLTVDDRRICTKLTTDL